MSAYWPCASLLYNGTTNTVLGLLWGQQDNSQRNDIIAETLQHNKERRDILKQLIFALGHPVPRPNANHTTELSPSPFLFSIIIIRVFAEFGWVRFLAVCFLYQINPNPRKNYLLREKLAHMALSNLIFLGLGWPWVGEFVGFTIIFMFYNRTEIRIINRKHPIKLNTSYFCQSEDIYIFSYITCTPVIRYKRDALLHRKRGIQCVREVEVESHPSLIFHIGAPTAVGMICSYRTQSNPPSTIVPIR